MGNSSGNLDAWAAAFEAHPAAQGGFIWDWVDQGLTPNPTPTPTPTPNCNRNRNRNPTPNPNSTPTPTPNLLICSPRKKPVYCAKARGACE